MANLMEAYSKRIAISESVYSKAHAGAKMDSRKKLAIAKVIENTDKFLRESFEQSTGTQRADMGLWKKFCLNLTTVALPNLIAHELVIVSPMSSMSGYITYINYTAGTTKGSVTQGDLFNNPFQLGATDYASSNYTANAVSEIVANGSADYKPIWGPVVKGTWHTIVVNTVEVEFDPKATYTDAELATQAFKDVKIITAGVVTFANLDSDGEVPAASLTNGCTVAYKYDNVVIPQNDLPILNAKMESIPLIAKARRIAVYYSQIAAFQAKTDYGADLGDLLAEQAVGRLSFEIDTEIVQLLDNTAGAIQAGLTWSKTLPVGVNKRDHYFGFLEMLSKANTIIYNRTKRFAANYMICAADVLNVLMFIDAWKAAPAGQMNGPYFAGTLNQLKVFVSPALAEGEYLIGVNGDDFMSSVAVYAPYMAIVPTQLLQYADGGTSQGWSTLYDLKVLNDNLIVKGLITA